MIWEILNLGLDQKRRERSYVYAHNILTVKQKTDSVSEEAIVLIVDWLLMLSHLHSIQQVFIEL